MSARFVWSNLEEFKADLRNLPAELAAEAGVIVISHAEGAANALIAAYPVGPTGNLRRGVGIKNVEIGPFGAGAIVYNKAPHAYLYDHGTEARHWESGKSTGAMWGKTAPTHLFARTMIRFRTAMYRALMDLVRRHGLSVSGDAAA